MTPDDLQRELDRIWRNVTAPAEGPYPSMPSAPPLESSSFVQEATREAIDLIRSRHAVELRRVNEMLEAKERSAREMSERLAAAERQLMELKRAQGKEDERVRREVLGVAAQAERAQKAFEAEQIRLREEEKLLRSIAEETRKQLAGERARWEELQRQWAEREQQYLIDLKGLQTLVERLQRESGQKGGESLRLNASLGEAKTAIEKTLGELLTERKAREASDKERDAALKRVKEVEEHFQELQNLWQEERKQWAELWERERSRWEGQKQEFSSWEEKVRKDREEWHAGMKTIEEREARYAGQIAETLRKSSEAGEKVAALLRSFGIHPSGVEGPGLGAVLRRRRRVVQGAAAAVLLGAGGWLWSRRPATLKLEPISASAVPVSNPSAAAYDGSALWACGWDGACASLDPADPTAVLARAPAPRAGPYHPVSLAVSGGWLYALDAAQARILKLSLGRPLEVLGMWPSPGPAPVALAHDGTDLWSYDAVTRTLYRHPSESGEPETFPLELEAAPSAMAWRKGELWVNDAKGPRLLVFARKDKTFSLKRVARLEGPILSLSLVARPADGGRERVELWALTGPQTGSPDPSLRKYLVK